MTEKEDRQKAGALYALLKDSFLEEIIDVEIKHSPDSEVERDETVIGTMSELEKRLYSLSRETKRMAAMMTISLQFDENSDDSKEKLIRTIESLKARHNCCMEIIFTIIRDRLISEIPENSGLGIRENFQVVTYKGDKGSRPQLEAVIHKIITHGDD